MKVKLKDWPFRRTSLSQIRFGFDELPEVVVCVVLSCWVHTTVSPTCMVRSWCLKFRISSGTVAPPGGGSDVAVGVGGGGVAVAVGVAVAMAAAVVAVAVGDFGV